MTIEWRSTFDDPPDWIDGRKRVVLLFADGREIHGRLVLEEFFTGVDEVPVPSVELDNGSKASFYDAEMWRVDDGAPDTKTCT